MLIKTRQANKRVNLAVGPWSTQRPDDPTTTNNTSNMSCLGGDTDSQRGEEGEPSRFSNGYNWIRSFSEKVRGRRSGEWEDTIGVIRRRRLQGECPTSVA